MADDRHMITTITGKNQVTVPASIVARASMHSGTRLDWEIASEHTLLVRVLPDRAELASTLQGSGRRHKRSGTSAVENLIAERERESMDKD